MYERFYMGYYYGIYLGDGADTGEDRADKYNSHGRAFLQMFWGFTRHVTFGDILGQACTAEVRGPENNIDPGIGGIPGEFCGADHFLSRA